MVCFKVFGKIKKSKMAAMSCDVIRSCCRPQNKSSLEVLSTTEVEFVVLTLILLELGSGHFASPSPRVQDFKKKPRLNTVTITT